MDADLGALSAIVERLRSVDRLGVAIAERALPGVLDEAQRTAAAGTTPSGEAWPLTKDGRRALPNAAKAITAHVSGAGQAVITLVLPAPYVYHQNAKGKTLPRREVLFSPDDGVPARMRDEIERSARELVAATMEGR